MMDIVIRKLINARQTGKIMHQMVNEFYTDMAPYASLSLTEIYDKIKGIPFEYDPKGVELVKRPYYTMNQIGPGGDCDDKAVALASWAVLNSIPSRFIGIGYKKNDSKKILLSHVYTQLYIVGEWLNIDSTYNFNTLGYVKGKPDRIEIL